MKKITIRLIRLYQRTLSPDHSWRAHRYPAGFCRHYPTCSEYTVLAIEHQGLMRGLFLGVKRVARCNPWAQPVVDLSYKTEVNTHV